MTVWLRDRREPNHGWYDNEIFTVFGDELGANGIHVYVTLTRLCYGTRVTMGLREMADEARMKKDTFARTLERVIALGLVIRHAGPTPKSACSYDLVNVKVLAAEYLRRSVQQERAKSVSRRDRSELGTLTELVLAQREALTDASRDDAPNCLTERQMDKKIYVAQDATDLSQNDVDFETDVSQNSSPFKTKTQDTRTQDKYNPPDPPASGGGGVPASRDGERRQAKLHVQAVRVRVACGATANRPLETVIWDALELYCAQTKCEPEQAGEYAVAMVALYQRDRKHLRCPWGWREFFRGGYWRSDELWQYDREALARMRRTAAASIGMYHAPAP